VSFIVSPKLGTGPCLIFNGSERKISGSQNVDLKDLYKPVYFSLENISFVF
jgi:hypothetical protein